MQLLSFSIGKKTVIWIKQLNKYVLAETLAAEIILGINDGKPSWQMAEMIVIKTGCSVSLALKIVRDIKKTWKANNELPDNKIISAKNTPVLENKIYSTKYYRFNNIDFEVEYETYDAEWYNHPKFAYLETPASKDPMHRFRVGEDSGWLSLWVNGEHSGSWPKTENHFLSGKFSMQFVQKLYRKDENQWMGVFHAAGISNGKQCLIFFGDSGNGKSTLSALLMAAGFDVLSDDFLPVESATGLVFPFPAAISVKKQAYELVMSLFPELKYSGEFVNPLYSKIYRFLPPNKINPIGVNCKAIILVKYDPSFEFELKKMAPEDSFAWFVPDSWINPNDGNPARFMQWFTNQEHYQLTYSDNDNMIRTIKKMLGNE